MHSIRPHHKGARACWIAGLFRFMHHFHIFFQFSDFSSLVLVKFYLDFGNLISQIITALEYYQNCFYPCPTKCFTHISKDSEFLKYIFVSFVTLSSEWDVQYTTIIQSIQPWMNNIKHCRYLVSHDATDEILLSRAYAFAGERFGEASKVELCAQYRFILTCSCLSWWAVLIMVIYKLYLRVVAAWKSYK